MSGHVRASPRDADHVTPQRWVDGLVGSPVVTLELAEWRCHCGEDGGPGEAGLELPPSQTQRCFSSFPLQMSRTSPESERPPASEPVWERPWSVEEIRRSSQNWSLAADAGVSAGPRAQGGPELPLPCSLGDAFP